MNINITKNENIENKNNYSHNNNSNPKNGKLAEKEKKIKEENVENLEKDKEKQILSSKFFKKYKPIRKIGQGSYSIVFEGKNIETGEKVSLKLEEKNKNEVELLKNEACYLYLLKDCPGIVKIISFGVTNKYNILIEPLLGKTLYSLFLESDKNFTLKDICLIAIQCLERLECVHSKGIIHCDIKPENFVIGSKDKRFIYLIDFGMSKKYRSDRTKNHIQFSITKTMTGTARYASTNALSGLQLSRRDDLESLSYIILYFLTKKLPWQGIVAKSMAKRYKKIFYKKKELEKWEKFKEIPLQIQTFIKYCRSLKFTQDPDYKKMKYFFYDLMKEKEIESNLYFSWIIDKSILDDKIPKEFQRKKKSSKFKLFCKLSKSTIDFSLKNSIINNVSDIKNIRTISPENNLRKSCNEKDKNFSKSINSVYNDKLEEENNDEEKNE